MNVVCMRLNHLWHQGSSDYHSAEFRSMRSSRRLQIRKLTKRPAPIIAHPFIPSLRYSNRFSWSPRESLDSFEQPETNREFASWSGCDFVERQTEDVQLLEIDASLNPCDCHQLSTRCMQVNNNNCEFSKRSRIMSLTKQVDFFKSAKALGQFYFHVLQGCGITNKQNQICLKGVGSD